MKTVDRTVLFKSKEERVEPLITWVELFRSTGHHAFDDLAQQQSRNNKEHLILSKDCFFKKYKNHV